jgi:hypothetical protein
LITVVATIVCSQHTRDRWERGIWNKHSLMLIMFFSNFWLDQHDFYTTTSYKETPLLFKLLLHERIKYRSFVRTTTLRRKQSVQTRKQRYDWWWTLTNFAPSCYPRWSSLLNAVVLSLSTFFAPTNERKKQTVIRCVRELEIETPCSLTECC